MARLAANAAFGSASVIAARPDNFWLYTQSLGNNPLGFWPRFLERLAHTVGVLVAVVPGQFTQRQALFMQGIFNIDGFPILVLSFIFKHGSGPFFGSSKFIE